MRSARNAVRSGGGRIGLLGGSFNPAHAGHRHISLEALKRLRLGRVWWLVSPQNPLKPREGMAPLGDRLVKAAAVADHPRIAVTGIEDTFGTTYSVDTVRALKRRFPATDFVWLIGADNLAQLPHWRRWEQLFREVPIAVFAREPWGSAPRASLAAARFAHARRGIGRAAHLAGAVPPAWCYLPTRRHPASATAIREAAGPAPAVPSCAADPAGLLGVVLGTLDEMKAINVVPISLTGKSSIADHMIVASGSSRRHVQAMTERLVGTLKPLLPAVPPVEGEAAGDWVLIDAGDVIIHLFRPEVREFYRLERMWDSGSPGGQR